MRGTVNMTAVYCITCENAEISFFSAPARLSSTSQRTSYTSWAGIAMKQSLATQQGGGSNPLDKTGLSLLSLDGGGVRGQSTLYILKGPVARLNHERREANLPTMKPCEVFDLVVGSSTGGLCTSHLMKCRSDH